MSDRSPDAGAPAIDPAALRYGDDGLLPVVVQEVAGGVVLMLGWADREAVERTLATGEVHFWSRSRRALWKKGETSGNTLSVVSIAADCDGDTLLIRADPAGPTCHRGTRTCFDPVAEDSTDSPTSGSDTAADSSTRTDRAPAAGPRLELGWLADVIAARRGADPASSYTARLLAAGAELAARKVGEEATEVVIAGLAATSASTSDDPETADRRRTELTGEAADLLYHLLVLLEAAHLDPAAVAAELRRRHTTGSSRR